MKLKMEKELTLVEELWGKKPKASLKNKILGLLDDLKLEQQIDWNSPPQLNPYSDAGLWQKAVELHQSPSYFDNIHTHLLFKDANRSLSLVWVKSFVPEEEHDYLQESFLILEGACVFYSNDVGIRYNTGDFVPVPNEKHRVEVTSAQPMKVVLQRLKVKA
jgi:hypothetical protein